MKAYHKLKPNESREQDGKPVHLTPAGIEHLRDELTRLKQRMPALALETQRTAEYGDRSDNAEYKQAKGALRRTHYRIFEIEATLKRAVTIPSGRNAAGTVQLGSKVTLAVGAGDAGGAGAGAKTSAVEKTFELVGPDETDPARGRISHVSPLGAALIGHKQGDIVTIKTGRGEQKYRIVEIK